MVSEAEVEAAAKAIYHHPRAPLQMTRCKELARAALEAAERVRIDDIERLREELGRIAGKNDLEGNVPGQ